jgi:hypothetical protein
VFQKTPRVAAHSAEGVIELMPTSDGTTYGFKTSIASMPTAWTSRIMLSTLTKGTTLSAAI